jgi:hypothetical protein
VKEEGGGSSRIKYTEQGPGNQPIICALFRRNLKLLFFNALLNIVLPPRGGKVRNKK